MFENVAKYLLGFAIFFDATVAWFILLKNPHRPANAAYFIMILGVTGWQLSNFISTYISLPSLSWQVFLGRAAFATASIAVIGMLYFSHIFSAQHHNRPFARICLTIAAIAIGVSFTPWIVRDVPFAELGHSVEYQPGPLYSSYSLFIIVIFIYIYRGLFRKIRTTTAEYVRQQTMYIITAFSFPIIIGSTTNLLIPSVMYYVHHGDFTYLSVSNIGPASSIFLTSIIAYAMMRHHLMDIRIALRRGTTCIVLYIFCVAILYVLLLGLHELFGFPARGSAVTYVFMVVMFSTILYYPGQYVLRRIFKRAYFDFYLYFSEEHAILKKAVNVEEYSGILAAMFLHRLPVERWSIAIYDHYRGSFEILFPRNVKKVFALDESWIQIVTEKPGIYERTQTKDEKLQKVFDALNVDWIVPLKVYDRLVGIVFFGARMDGEKFSHHNRRFIGWFQAYAARNVWNVLQMHHHVRVALDNSEYRARMRKLFSRDKMSHQKPL